MRKTTKHPALGAPYGGDASRYGEVDKNGVTNQDAALFNAQEAEIVGIIQSYTGTNADGITRETKLSSIRNCDSLDVVQIVMDCEEHFAIEISDATVENICTLGDLFAAVADKKKKG